MMRYSHAPNGWSGKKPVQRLEGVKKSFLNRVLRVLVREHDGATHGVRPTLMQANELRERVARAALRRDDEGSLVRLDVSCWRHAERQLDCGRSGHRDVAGVHSH